MSESRCILSHCDWITLVSYEFDVNISVESCLVVTLAEQLQQKLSNL